MEIRMRCQVRMRGGRGEQFTGITEDMSREGILVHLNHSENPHHFPLVGDIVSIIVDLPESQSTTPRCLYCDAVAVRVEDAANGARRVAFRIDRMSFQDRAESRPISASAVPETAGGRFVN